MDATWLAGVTGFAFAMAATPGPNNTMATASGATYGVARTMPLMAGISLGVAVIMLVVAAFGSSVVADPRVSSTLKWIGVAYLVWLAWKIGSAEPVLLDGGDAGTTKDAPLTFTQGAVFQLVNPKLWVMVGGAVVTFGQAADGINAMSLAILFAVIFGSLTFLSTIAWAALGVSIGRLLESHRAVRLFNASMALLLLTSLIPIVFE